MPSSSLREISCPDRGGSVSLAIPTLFILNLSLNCPRKVEKLTPGETAVAVAAAAAAPACSAALAALALNWSKTSCRSFHSLWMAINLRSGDSVTVSCTGSTSNMSVSASAYV